MDEGWPEMLSTASITSPIALELLRSETWGVVDGNKPATDNDWETITRGGDRAIGKWIDEHMKGRSCVVVLIGKDTANRKWINHEILTGWNQGKGVVGVVVLQSFSHFGTSDRSYTPPGLGLTPLAAQLTPSSQPLPSVFD